MERVVWKARDLATIFKHPIRNSTHSFLAVLLLAF